MRTSKGTLLTANGIWQLDTTASKGLTRGQDPCSQPVFESSVQWLYEEFAFDVVLDSGGNYR